MTFEYFSDAKNEFSNIHVRRIDVLHVYVWIISNVQGVSNDDMWKSKKFDLQSDLDKKDIRLGF